MRALTKITITAITAIAGVLMLAINVPMLANTHTAYGENSVRVTQSSEDGLVVECEGNLKCEITGDETVVATSEDNSASTITSTITTSTTLNQSDSEQLRNEIDNEIENMTDRILEEIFD
jgi:hypothetical protein